MNPIMIKTLIAISAVLIAGCTHQSREPMQIPSYVDIEKFMGDWHVLANIPTFPERGAINPVETYSMNENGTINTRFSFIHPKTGARKELRATGFVLPNTNNAIWGMQFLWPLKADYRVVYLDPYYETTIVGREKRDYLWIMARDANLPAETLNYLIDKAVQMGYDRSLIQLPPRREALRAAG